LPPLDESIRDKIMLFRCAPATMKLDEQDPTAFAKWEDTIKAEIPGFLHWLRGWQIPEDMRNLRFGVKAHLSADLVDAIDSLSQEMRFWQLIQMAQMIPIDGTWWKGTASQLEAALREKYRSNELDRVLTWSTACGVFLSRLALKYPDKIKHKSGVNHVRTWEIDIGGQH